MPAFVPPAALDADRVFSGVFPTGISYADRKREKGGDYAALAFLSFATLELSFQPDCPAALRPGIAADARKIQARKGELYRVSTAGQTVLLGSALAEVSALI